MIQAGETARDLLAEGDNWTSEMARAALPILLWAARKHRTITYKQLAEELQDRTGEPVRRRMTLYGNPAGKIGDALILLAEETGWDIPPLNAIVVNAVTELPGDGATYFIKRLLQPHLRKNISKGDTEALARAAVEAVLNYNQWDTVAQALHAGRITTVKVLQATPRESAPIKRPQPSTKPNGYAESPQHKALKRWAVNNPAFFEKYGKFPKGNANNEERLESGDRLDAYLHNASTRLAVEVKASNAPESEVFRGVFQCIKYRATLRAMQTADSLIPNANAVLLVTHTPPAEAKRLARRLQVDILIAPFEADHG